MRLTFSFHETKFRFSAIFSNGYLELEDEIQFMKDLSKSDNIVDFCFIFNCYVFIFKIGILTIHNLGEHMIESVRIEYKYEYISIKIKLDLDLCKLSN